ncbi:MAG: enoyl-CoA hydratase-related protein [Caulobacteraceae bacterium]
MTTYNDLIVDHRGAVSWLYLNRPQALNAISLPAMRELREALIELRDRDETRVIVLSGKGRGFCAGADLGGALPDRAAPPSPEPDFLALGTAMEAVLNNIEKPIIAAVNGVAAGGGLELALMCDFIVAAETAKIGDAHSNFGALPGGGASARLPRVIGINRARYLMLSGELLLAPELVSWGLVSKVWPADQFEDETQKLAEKLAGKSPLGLKHMKRLLTQALDIPLDVALHNEKLTATEYMRSHDAAEGGKAFMEKRPPQFKGY